MHQQVTLCELEYPFHFFLKLVSPVPSWHKIPNHETSLVIVFLSQVQLSYFSTSKYSNSLANYSPNSNIAKAVHS